MEAAKIAKTEEKAIAAARIKLNVPADVDPTGALLEALWRASVLVGFWQSRCELISVADSVVPDALNAGIARPRIEILRYEAAVERLAEFAKLAIATGLAERQVRVIEEQGRLMDRAMRAVLDDLDLTADQRNAAPGIIRRRVLELVPGLESELADTP